MSERVEKIRRRHEAFIAQYSPGPDWEPFNQMSEDRGYLLAALAQAEAENARLVESREEKARTVVQCQNEIMRLQAENELLRGAPRWTYTLRVERERDEAQARVAALEEALREMLICDERCQRPQCLKARAVLARPTPAPEGEQHG